VTEATDGRARLTFAAPAIAVADVAAAAGWFEARLGFRAAGTSGTPPVWASLRRDGVEIMLTRAAAAPPSGGLAAYVYVDDADALHAELTALGAELTGPPVDRAWGCREVEARLPDGRSIVFGADLSGASDSH
jgi:catechol 2,3-dioxygenase-like lactoylglutathione lyase family enzyme